MKLRSIAYAAVIAVAATAFTLASATTSEAAKSKKKKAAPAPAPAAWCWPGSAGGPVCGTRGGLKFTYANACYATRDGAKVVSNKACPAPKAKKAKKGGKKAAKKKM
jgi:hypothetical protein